MNKTMNMPVFSSSTQITFLFTGWTTSTTTQYTLTLIFLFLLAILNRFLSALNFQLEQSWSHPSTNIARIHRQKEKLSPIPIYTRLNDEEEASLPSPLNNDINIDKADSKRARKSGCGCGFWKCLFSWEASGKWSLWTDGTRALIESVRALIGYLLMLAVMTFNVGVFLAVLGGVLVGELFLGRFSRGRSGWQEGTCHGN